MPGGIIIQVQRIDGFGDRVAVANNHCAKRASTLFNVAGRQGQGLLQIVIMCRHALLL